jgi:probable phosphoglycerate mutase
VVICSPYVRAQMTAELIRRAGGLSLAEGQSFIADERLREKEFGMLDRLTTTGIAQLYPEQAERGVFSESFTIALQAARAGAT